MKTKFECRCESIAGFFGTPVSVVVHTVAIAGMFALYLTGVKFDTVLLTVTTVLSIEAIYLQLFSLVALKKQDDANPNT